MEANNDMNLARNTFKKLGTDNGCTCGASLPDNTYLCLDCTRDLGARLDALPEMLSDLADAHTRQTRMGSGSGRAGSGQLPWDDRAAGVLRDAELLMVSWRLTAETATGTISRAYTAPAVARWLRTPWMLRAVIGQPWTGRLHRELTRLSSNIERAIDRPESARFVGPCWECQRNLYVKPGAVEVKCTSCDLTYDVDARRDWLLAEAEDVLATAADVSRALTSMGQPVTPERIRQWALRGRLLPKGHVTVGTRVRPTYRVGDVLALLG